MKKQLRIAAGIAVATAVLVMGNVHAGWGIKDLDPFNKNSGIRKSGREIDQQRLDAGAYNFYLHNKCAEYLDVTFEYIPRGSSKWKANNYSFAPGEHARLDATRNRNVYIAAHSTSSYSNRQWPRKMINMGPTYTKYTYSLTCG